jgi:DNA repair ATPase RecN
MIRIYSHKQKENIMKFRTRSLAIFTTLLLSTASFLGGCATTGMDRSVKTSNSIRDVDSEIRKLIVQIDATSKSLDNLVGSGSSDLKKSYNSYSDNVDKLDSEGKRVLKRIDEMKSHSKEYFAEWEKQGVAYKNPEISALSEERRTKLAEIYARVPAAAAGVKSSYLSYLTNLKEIKSYLSNDLTAKGIETIDPVAKKTVQDLEVLKTSLQPVIAALDEIKVELYSGKK